MRLTVVTTGLRTGGAETMLLKLLGAARSRVEAEVVSLTTEGAVGPRIAALGVPVRALAMRGGLDAPGAVVRLARELRRSRPDVVQTWMYHADLIGGLAARRAGVPAVWGLRQSNLDPVHSPRRTIWTARACARLSHRVPARIACCSEASRRVHAALGYDEARMVVIPNGFDAEAFRPDASARASVRRELGLLGDAPLVGLVGRFDPQKDHGTFLRAAGLLRARWPEARFVLCGDGVTADNAALAAGAREAGVLGSCHFLGPRGDMPRLQAAFDVAALSSAYGEGFPNVVGEAMACGVPCVVTDIGDSAEIVGPTGRVVPPRDPRALAEAMDEVLSLGPEKRRELGALARQRVVQRYTLAEVARRYEALWEEVACAASPES